MLTNRRSSHNCKLDREKYPIRPKMVLLEFDERFNVFKDEFVPYDFKQPLKLDSMSGCLNVDKTILMWYAESLKGAFDRIICDPPFLSEECQTKCRFSFVRHGRAHSVLTDFSQLH